MARLSVFGDRRDSDSGPGHTTRVPPRPAAAIVQMQLATKTEFQLVTNLNGIHFYVFFQLG